MHLLTSDPTAAAWDALATVIDPELGLDLVALGLVYAVEATDEGVRVLLTTTSAACPLHEHIGAEARRAVASALPEGANVEVEFTWTPPWTPERLSPTARMWLGA